MGTEKRTSGRSKQGKTKTGEPAFEHPALHRRDFVKLAGFGSPALVTGLVHPTLGPPPSKAIHAARLETPLPDESWPSLRSYDRNHLARIALPLGGIGTGTVSLGGNGNLRDWEVMNRPAKGFIPSRGNNYPFFAAFVDDGESTWCRLLEGPVDPKDYEGSHGSRAPNANLPRFQDCSFSTAYPLGRVVLSDQDLPFEVHIKAFNPLIPCDIDSSSLPVAILDYEFHNRSSRHQKVSVCGSLPNFIGIDGWETSRDWKGDRVSVGAKKNRNQLRSTPSLRGIFLRSEGVAPTAEQWGTLALATTRRGPITHRLDWSQDRWGSAVLDFWDDFASDGKLEPRDPGETDIPMASLSVEMEVPPGTHRTATFLLAWHFPNRYSWTPAQQQPGPEDRVGNHYTTRFQDAWDVLERTRPELDRLKQGTIDFVQTFCNSPLPVEVREAALFNISTLRTQTCFRTADGRFYGWEGIADQKGCCHGSCTHVWNYEQATAFLFGELAMSMREVEFLHATNDEGLMSFRVNLPLPRARSFGKAAADGQLGCIMKMYRDWQLSGDSKILESFWPRVRKALEFCWIKGGWDADQDGVMEGCQHNTMDVEYYGPNPQMEIWYLGALRAAEEMARRMEDHPFADKCRDLFQRGSRWIDGNLFNGEYYEHRIVPPQNAGEVAPSLRVGMGAMDPATPELQLGKGCLVDQLVGQFLAHVCGLGYLVNRGNVRKALQSILKYNRRQELNSHFNSMRTFALGSESALLMADYPSDRPTRPFPYFTEAMTGFEYTAAVGMLYEGLIEEGLSCIASIRQRYDGKKRNPFDEAECGHHYARAMASWGAVLSLTGFHYSGVLRRMTFAPLDGDFFWSNGYCWGRCRLQADGTRQRVHLMVKGGRLLLKEFRLAGYGEETFEKVVEIGAGEEVEFEVLPA